MTSEENRNIISCIILANIHGQLDFLKSLAILTNTVYVLAGTYELLTLDTLSAQLGRRSIVAHFPRYQATNKDNVRAFKTVLQAFQRQHGRLYRPSQGMVAQSTD